MSAGLESTNPYHVASIEVLLAASRNIPKDAAEILKPFEYILPLNDLWATIVYERAFDSGLCHKDYLDDCSMSACEIFQLVGDHIYDEINDEYESDFVGDLASKAIAVEIEKHKFFKQ